MASAQTTRPRLPDAFDLLESSHGEVMIHLEKLAAIAAEPVDMPMQSHVRAQARAVIAYLSGPARHNHDEELCILPLLIRCEDPEVRRTAKVLYENHAWIELLWLDMKGQLETLAAGGRLWDVDSFRSAVGSFVELMREHIALETSFLYPRLRGGPGYPCDRCALALLQATAGALADP